MFLKSKHSNIEQIHFSEISDKDFSLFIKREDELHPFISGNKYRKLKYNLIHLKEKNIGTAISFGGAFSNHIAATAAYCAAKNLKSMGIIRGERPKTLNPTLVKAEALGVKLDFISRED